MSRQTFLRIAAVVTLVLGAGLMVLPGPIVAYFNNDQYPNTVHFVRFLGTALTGFGVLNWMGSAIEDAEAALPGMYGNLTSLVLASLIDVIGLTYRILNPRGWLILALHLVFVVGFSYFAWGIRSETTQKVAS